MPVRSAAPLRARLAALCIGLVTGVSACSTLDPDQFDAAGQRPVEASRLPASEPPAVDPSGPESSLASTTTSTGVAGSEPSKPPLPSGAEGEIGRLVPVVVSTRPHDSAAFTQGFELFEGTFLESTGLYGTSTRRRVDTDTGENLASTSLPSDVFGSGLTVYQNIIIQLTWREGVALLADPVTLEELDRFEFEGEGWGICAFDEELAMSNGTGEIVFRDPMSFLPVRSITVTLDGTEVSRLNELECVGDQILANVWLTNDILMIDSLTGDVVATVDASSLAPSTADPEDVLNGIAFDEATDTYFLTGKRWDTIYQVRFVPSA